MNPTFKTIEEFFQSIRTDLLEELIPKFGYSTKWEIGQEFNLFHFESFLNDINDGESSYWDNAKKEAYTKLPLKVVDYEHASETDMDHGEITDTYVVEVGGKFYEFNLNYYGQGEFYADESKWNHVFEVKPKEITKIIYERV